MVLIVWCTSLGSALPAQISLKDFHVPYAMKIDALAFILGIILSYLLTVTILFLARQFSVLPTHSSNVVLTLVDWLMSVFMLAVLSSNPDSALLIPAFSMITVITAIRWRYQTISVLLLVVAFFVLRPNNSPELGALNGVKHLMIGWLTLASLIIGWLNQSHSGPGLPSGWSDSDLALPDFLLRYEASTYLLDYLHRTNMPVSVLMMDLNVPIRLQINLMAQTAIQLSHLLRPLDVMIRYEEAFLVLILPATTNQDAHHLISAIQFEQLDLPAAASPRFVLALLPPVNLELDSLLNHMKLTLLEQRNQENAPRLSSLDNG